MSGLRITRPLVVFDLETTGIDIGRDRIVEIGVVRLDPDGSRDEWVQRINPEMPIPPGATASRFWDIPPTSTNSWPSPMWSSQSPAG